ncbi:pH-response regulator palH RIM21 [Lecanosticta acicola]|uniref:PH-response regulator palH RIM21 n=1 Tax=Lecanosticta acicola TaxID=111012 RepID=A0AAI8Z0J4_9PEZI|nr:pH-response regulator palH RIM21 [Lecanosticta acicola]
MADVRDLVGRQLWNPPAETTTSKPHCTPFTLPSNGVIRLGDSAAITLTTNVVFQPECTGTTTADNVFAVSSLKNPFYASVIPMVYVIASATVIAWILVVMLTITPRTQFFGLPSQQAAFSNVHGIIGGAHGGAASVSGGGSRPWLQKVATIAVAISLTIATADTLEVAERQYYMGVMDADTMRKEVLGSLEIRITRVVSDVFLWLAQVQTLIRLFPRHKEKVLIKWIGFLLIILDTVFSCLNSFLINSQAKGRHFVNAIPALSYLFELALGLLYAAWVLYYSMTKRRYAYYNPKMRSISLIALLSIVSILTPVVFFVTDVSNQDVAGWGDYFRWVGAAAASVVVWEWVERTEALERDDKKDGILGREIFDGDEMLDVMPNDDTPWSQSRSLARNYRQHRDEDQGDGNQASRIEHGFSGMANRFRRHEQSPQHFPLGRAHSSSEQTSSDPGRSDAHSGHITFGSLRKPTEAANSRLPTEPSAPEPTASPVSRGDTNSAASTVYVVRYHPVADVAQPIRRRLNATGARKANGSRRKTEDSPNEKEMVEAEGGSRPNRNRESGIWQSVPNPFKRKRTSPPQEVQRARAAAGDGQGATTPAHNFSRWDVKNRLGVFATETGDRFRERAAGRKQQVDLPVTIIPAQPRGSGRTWSPDQRAVMTMSAPRTTTEANKEPPDSAGNTSATLVDSQTALGGDSSRPKPYYVAVGTHADSSEGPMSTAASTPHRPPRADEIRPGAGRGGSPIVIPAPQRRTPASQQAPTPPAQGRGSESSNTPRKTPPHG